MRKISSQTALCQWQATKGEAKPLFRDILPAGPCVSRFYPDATISKVRKLLKEDMLATGDMKEIELGYPALPMLPRASTTAGAIPPLKLSPQIGV